MMAKRYNLAHSLDQHATREILGVKKNLAKLSQSSSKDGQLKTRYRCECGHEFDQKDKFNLPVFLFAGCDHCPHAYKAKQNRLYRVWSGMIQRCTNPNNKSYGEYGGRGITVCKRWRKVA